MTKKEKMYEKIEKHGNYVKEFFGISDIDPIKLSKKLFSLENKLHHIYELYCNGNIEDSVVEYNEKQTKKRLEKIGIILDLIKFNRDPRGYAIKIKSDKWNGFKDFGGYGILTPDFNL